MFFSNLLKKKMTLKFSKQTFALQNVPDLLLNVFDYFTGPCPNCHICKQYTKWCIEILSARWRSDYYELNFVINSLRNGNPNFPDFGKTLNATKNRIYAYIRK